MARICDIGPRAYSRPCVIKVDGRGASLSVNQSETIQLSRMAGTDPFPVALHSRDPRDTIPCSPGSRMKHRHCLFRLCIAALACGGADFACSRPPLASDCVEPPQVLFEDLFVAVQSQGLFADGKAFPDAVPLESPGTILEAFRRERPPSPTALRQFVAGHFKVPEEVRAPGITSSPKRITAHIDALWDVLTRSTPTAAACDSLLALPEPYVVPGGRFREVYYWDSYFTMLGLQASHRGDLVHDMVRDFAYLIETYGHVPNGTRTYYLSRSQPPFFFAMLGLLSPEDPPAALSQYLPQLQREYAFWMQGEGQLRAGSAHRRVVALADGAILNRYWDDRDTPRDEAYREDTQLADESHRAAKQLYRDIRAATESGWDFSSRWFSDPHDRSSFDTTEIVPVDLNSLLYGLENAIRAGCLRDKDSACAREFQSRAQRRRRAIDHYLWDATRGAYRDYRFTRRVHTERISGATFYPLFVGAASPEQAAAVAAAGARELLKAGGIVTTPVSTGEQWDAPNGWAPLQWIAVDGLRHYHEMQLAQVIACRWLVNVEQHYRKTGMLLEKYDVLAPGHAGGGGEYPTQQGFGWTNGVTRALLELYPQNENLSDVEDCPKPSGPSARTAN